MSYERLDLSDGTKFSAEHVKHIEDGIVELYNKVNASGTAVRIQEVELLAGGWVGEVSPYSQVVSIDGVTIYSQIDLKPTIEQLAIFHNKDLAFVAENDDGAVTVYALGDKPANDYTIQVSITEVSA